MYLFTKIRNNYILELWLVGMINKNRPLDDDNSHESASVMIELRVDKTSDMTLALRTAQNINKEYLKLDESFAPVPMTPDPELASGDNSNEITVIVRGRMPEEKIQELESHPDVIRVWKDTPIAPFSCPIPPCDCTDGDPAIGDLTSVAKYLGVDKMWMTGKRGKGIIIGIVDGGITAIDKVPKRGETARIPRVIDGTPTDWGTTASDWDEHGNMTATDALGMAPLAQIYDIRISGSTTEDTISNALAGFHWAIEKHKFNGTPQILSNSWGIFQESWDKVYARDPKHPFTCLLYTSPSPRDS